MPDSAKLIGVVVDDGQPAGAGLTLKWSTVSGPGTVSFANSAVAVTGASFSAAGDYVLQLSASDSQLTGSASMTVHVTDSTANKAPVITPLATQTLDFGANPTGVITLAPTITDDGLPVGSKLSYTWNLVSGQAGNITVGNPTAASTPITIRDSGFNQTFVVSLTVDDSRLSSTANFTINTITGNQAPQVNAGPGGTITLPTNTFTLNGTVTDDGKPAGSTLTSSWALRSGPAPVTFADPTKPVTVVTFPPTPGVYAFTLSASDGQFTTSSFNSVTVNPANQAPVVNVTSPFSITLPTNVATMNGTVTDDGLPSGIINIQWVMLSGAAPVVFSAPNQAVTQVTFSKAGGYQLQLRADDTQLQTVHSVFIQVNPQNQAPVVSAGPNQSIALPTNTVTLQGTVTDDGLPAGATVTQQWSEVSGPAPVTFSAPTSTTTQATFTTAGTYDLRLTASDTQLTGSADVTITVAPGPQNLPPTVSAGLNQVLTLPGPNQSVSVFLNGSVKDDGLPVGKPVTQQWSVVSGPGPVTFSTPLNPGTVATFTVAGSYDLRLTATDTQLTSSADVLVVVNPPVNRPPSISGVTFPSQVFLPNNTVTFSATVTDDGLPNGTLTQQWNQLSGPVAATFSAPTSATTQVTLPVAGSYSFQLSASDSQLTTTATIFLQVIPNQAPTVSLSPSFVQISLPLNTVTFTATATDDGLPSGQLSFTWSQMSGPAPMTISNPTATFGQVTSNHPVSTSTQVTFPVQGTYLLRVNVSDGQLSTETAVETIVNPAVPPLQVAILSPGDGATITQPVSVTGNVSDSGNWTLDYALASGNDGDTPAFITLATGVGPKAAGVLATFDPSVLLNGVYTLRLSASDNAGQTASTTTTVFVQKNVKVGNLTLSFNDLTVPVPGLPIQIIRTYDSRDKRLDDFGFSWSLSLANVRLQKNRNLGKNWNETASVTNGFSAFCLDPNDDRLVTITFPDGKVYEFQAGSGPECQLFAPITTPTLRFTQVPTMPGTVGATLQPADGAALSIDGSVPGPQNIIDFNANIYNPTLFQLTTAEGYTYIIDQHFGVTSMTDPNGNKLTISASGITSSTGLSVGFVRDAQNRITQINNANGKPLLYTYSPQGDLATFTDAQGNKTSYSYGNNHLLAFIFDGLRSEQFFFDSAGHLIQSSDSFGHVIKYNNNLAANQQTITDRLGNPTTYAYDNDGNVLSITDALGNIISRTFDGNDNKLSETDALGKTSSFTYDSANNRLSETDPLGNVTKYTYNGLHQVLTVTDPLGHTTTRSYDTRGNLLSTKDAAGNTTTYTYNAQGLPLTLKDALSNTTSFVYDANGRVTQLTDGLNNVNTFTYDSNGNRLTQAVTRTRADGTKETLTTKYQYDNDNRLIQTTNPDNTFTQIAYNVVGNPTDVLDALGRKRHYDYDPNSRLTKTTYPDQTTESITYDANDRRLTWTDRANHTTSYTYDAVGRLTKTTFADNSTAQTVYDAAGRTIQTIDALNHTTAFAYDDAGRRTSITDALNHTTTFAYDAASNQTSMTDALNHTTQFAYDKRNRRIQTTYPDTTTDSVAYDALGRLASKTDQAGKVTQYGYDALSRLSTVTQFLNNNSLVTSYAYDEVGSRISQTDANGHVTNFSYDQLGRRSTRTLPLGMSESYGYDANGNLTSKKDFNGHTTSYLYDTMNRLTKKTADTFFTTGACAGGACGASQITFTYTPTGRRLAMTDASGTTNYTYDTRDRLLTKAAPAGTLTYTYDGAGNTLSLKSSNAGGASMTYGYDQLNRLSSATDASGVTNYSYDAVGNLSGYTYPNGVSTSYSFDTLNRLTSLKSTCASGTGCGPANTTINSYTYTLGAAGNRLSVAELSGRTVNYGYDDLYRLTSETIIGAATQNGTVSYQYDSVGNRQKITSTLPAISSSGLLNYDANDRTATDPYDANGNFLTSGAGGNVYDFENRLVGAGARILVYDGDGNRVSENLASGTTKYLVADENLTGYAQVLDELQSGAVSRTYSYGLELINEQQSIAGTPTTSFYGFDGHGSVRYLTSSTGALTDTYDYDAFGNLISSTGTTPNNYLFAGEQFDPSLGIYYNRARYYDQRLGRFWSMDAYEGDGTRPISLHKYLYVSANPPNRRDRNGNQDVISTTETLAVNNIEEGAVVTEGEVAAALQRVVADTLADEAEAAVSEAGASFFARALAAATALGILGSAILSSFSSSSSGDMPDVQNAENADRQITLWRDCDEKVSPSTFRVDSDGISLFERPGNGNPPKPYSIPFSVTYRGFKQPGARITGVVTDLELVQYAIPVIWTPQHGGYEHWSMIVPFATLLPDDDFSKSKKVLSDFGKVKKQRIPQP
jgi:RHS repeat-associated protein